MHVQTDKVQWSTQRYDLWTVIVCNRIDRRIKNKYHTFWAVPTFLRLVLSLLPVSLDFSFFIASSALSNLYWSNLWTNNDHVMQVTCFAHACKTSSLTYYLTNSVITKDAIILNIKYSWHRNWHMHNKNVDIKFSAHDAFQELPSSGTLKIERLEWEII